MIDKNLCDRLIVGMLKYDHTQALKSSIVRRLVASNRGTQCDLCDKLNIT